MTRDKIIRLASQAIDDTRSEVDLPIPFVMRFAMLVAAAEREACADLAESFTGRPGEHDGTAIAAAIRDRRNQPPKGED